MWPLPSVDACPIDEGSRNGAAMVPRDNSSKIKLFVGNIAEIHMHEPCRILDICSSTGVLAEVARRESPGVLDSRSPGRPSQRDASFQAQMGNLTDFSYHRKRENVTVTR